MNLDINKIKEIVGDKYRNLQIFVYNSVDSTNIRAKESAKDININNAVFISSEQTAGRGRLGRSFVSARDKGLYLSILTKTPLQAEEAVNLTTYMATIAADVIEELCDVEICIKWVNDLYCAEKKLAGILTEGEIDQDGKLSYSVVGIGINLYSQTYPDEIKNIAIDLEALSGTKIDINRLAGLLILSFFENLSLVGSKETAKKYKSRSFIIGKEIRVIKLSEEYDARVIGITDDCRLEIIRRDGQKEFLSTGEISIKTIN